MSAPFSSPFTTLWRKWKALKLPWRKRWLAGTDLVGNSFWYFKPSSSMPKARRIMQNNPKIPYSDLNISPMWHQWLRYTRSTPPSMQEQQTDVVRQIQLKHNAQLADARWAAKPSVLDAPRRRNMELGVGDGEAEGTVGKKWEKGAKTGSGKKIEKPTSEGEKRERQNPWQRDRGIAGEGWQPETWTPGPGKR